MVRVESLANEPFKFKIAIPSIGAETEEHLFSKIGGMMMVKVTPLTAYIFTQPLITLACNR